MKNYSVGENKFFLFKCYAEILIIKFFNCCQVTSLNNEFEKVLRLIVALVKSLFTITTSLKQYDPFTVIES
jgi:hypothetical protein